MVLHNHTRYVWLRRHHQVAVGVVIGLPSEGTRSDICCGRVVDGVEVCQVSITMWSLKEDLLCASGIEWSSGLWMLVRDGLGTGGVCECNRKSLSIDGRRLWTRVPVVHITAWKRMGR